jgi:hypothetical protein
VGRTLGARRRGATRERGAGAIDSSGQMQDGGYSEHFQHIVIGFLFTASGLVGLTMNFIAWLRFVSDE